MQVAVPYMDPTGNVIVKMPLTLLTCFKAKLRLMCIIFLIIGFCGLVGSTISHGCFSILGEAMTQRLRVAILTSIFRQEVGFHDDPQHAPGELSCLALTCL